MTLQEFCGPVWRGGVKKVHRSLRWQKTASPCSSVGEDPKKGEVRLLFTFLTDSNHLLWEGFLVGPMAAPILHQRSVQGQKRNPRKLTQHPQPMAHQRLQLRKPLSLRTELAKVQSHHTQRQNLQNPHTQRQNLPMLHQNHRIPLQNLLTLHPDLPIPPQSLPTTPLQNLPTPHQHPSPPTPPFPPIPPHNLSLTVPSLPTPPHNPLTVQCHPTPMRLLQSENKPKSGLTC